MKRYFIVPLLITAIAVTLPLILRGAQGELPDLKQIRQELEIMESVLQTTLRFASRDLQPEERSSTEAYFGKIEGFGFHISSFYLQGQGAIFTIPVSIRHTSGAMAFSGEGAFIQAEHQLMEAQHELIDLQAHAQQLAEEQSRLAEMQANAGAGVGGGVQGGVVGGVPGGVPGGVVGGVPQVPSPSPPPPGQAPVAPEKPAPAARAERAKQRAAEIQEKIKERGKEQEQRQAEFWKRIDQLKQPLVEALARHGGSLTGVKPNEYITLILSGEGKFDFGFGGSQETQRRVLSVPKSAIADYNAGRISLEQFKSKVLDYRN